MIYVPHGKVLSGLSHSEATIFNVSPHTTRVIYPVFLQCWRVYLWASWNSIVVKLGHNSYLGIIREASSTSGWKYRDSQLNNIQRVRDLRMEHQVLNGMFPSNLFLRVQGRGDGKIGGAERASGMEDTKETMLSRHDRTDAPMKLQTVGACTGTAQI